VNVYGPQDIADKKQFPYDKFHALTAEKTVKIGSFMVVPFSNFHDVPIFGYLINHPDSGSILFSTDSYKLGMTLRGVEHFLIEANYSDELLKQNVWDGKIDRKQADRIMLSHMSLEYCIDYLKDCEAQKSAKTITLCHLSERNSNPEHFREAVAGAFGVPCFVASKGLVVELNKEDL
jgi:ribonuclease BN (tRNA processing enzyme)